ncbi:MAG: hypothetical protein ACREMJ_02190 [Gemmatimonadales bacterium]
MYGAAAHAAAVAQAIKASGTIVRLEPAEFERFAGRIEAPLVVTARSRFFGERFHYLTSYKGLAFYSKSSAPVNLPGRAEIIDARTIWVPR